MQNLLKKRIEEKKRVVGTWSMTASPIISNIIGNSGLDFVIFDMEHGLIDYPTLWAMVRSLDSTDCIPIVRLGNVDEKDILKVLECGIKNIMISHISTEKQVRDIIRYSKYHPDGHRSISPHTINHRYTHNNLKDSLHKNNEEICIGILLEGIDCIELAKKISKMDNIDLIYIGIYDLSQELGIPGDLYNKKVIDLQKEFADIVIKNNKIAGSFAMDIPYIKILDDNGFNFISYSTDSYILKNGYEKVIK